MRPDNTIEFRIFNGTLNIMTLSKAIEFIHSLLSYCSQTSFKDIVNNSSEMNKVNKYLDFLSNNQKRYLNLCIFLDSEMKEILSTQKRRKLFGVATQKVSRKMLQDGINHFERSANAFHQDRKGMIV